MTTPKQNAPFERLHADLQHHIANSLGWSDLREVQKRAVEPVRNGHNTILLAPTAGGKTEAAFFPIISNLLDERWEGLSVLYVSPLRALLNNQYDRLERLFGLVGYEVGVWHGDIARSRKDRIKEDPPHALLTTPESLEGMLISQTTGAENLFSDLRVAVVDEVHAFADDDRGWHMLGVLERLGRWADRDLQRLGLSATVGNPGEIVEWMSGTSERSTTVIDPPDPEGAEPDVALDYVASTANAAEIIAQMYRGDRTLAFCDSRIQAETLARDVRSRDVTTYLNHSSLSRAERRRTERAFREGGPGVIVATSALELGIDIGDLDRVVQLDAPNSVASFLQRMGRTGRREGESANITMLATTDPGVLRGAALVDLWDRGFVESATPPGEPYHILAQQMLATVLERPGLGVDELTQAARTFCEAADLDEEQIEPLLRHLVDESFLFVDGHRVGVGRRGEEEFGARHFLEIVSVFTTPPIFTVEHQNSEIGSVHQATFAGRGDDERTVILLAGRSWLVEDLDWDRRIAYVEPYDAPGSTSWLGAGAGLPPRLAEAHREVLLGSDRGREAWTDRAEDRMEHIRARHQFLEPDRPVAVRGVDDWDVYTFFGSEANALIRDRLEESDFGPDVVAPNASSDGLSVRLHEDPSASQLGSALRAIGRDPTLPPVEPDHPMLRTLKFSELLPAELLQPTASARLYGVRDESISELGEVRARDADA